MTTYVRIIARFSQQITQSTRDRLKQRATTKARSHQTVGGSLARKWSTRLPRRRPCCVLLLLRLGLSAASASNRWAVTVVASVVCECWNFRLLFCACTPRALAYVNTQPPRHGVTKSTIGGSLARSWPPSLPHRRCCCVLLLLLLDLSANAAADNKRCAVVTSDVCECWGFRLLCVCMLTYVWSFLVWARGTACVVRYTTLSAATAVVATAAASASTYCCCRWCCRWSYLLSWGFERWSPGGGK